MGSLDAYIWVRERGDRPWHRGFAVASIRGGRGERSAWHSPVRVACHDRWRGQQGSRLRLWTLELPKLAFGDATPVQGQIASPSGRQFNSNTVTATIEPVCQWPRESVPRANWKRRHRWWR
jgi:hypothetical protein